MVIVADYMRAIWAWCYAHPAIAWPIFTAILTLLLKPRTAAEYEAIAKVSPRLAGALRLLGAIGLDAPKVVQSLKEIFRKGGGALLLLVLALAPSACGVKPPVRPAAFGAELARCEAAAPSGPAGWEKYSPCCADVYRRFPLPDGAPRDPADCYPPSATSDGGAP